MFWDGNGLWEQWFGVEEDDGRVGKRGKEMREMERPRIERGISSYGGK